MKICKKIIAGAVLLGLIFVSMPGKSVQAAVDAYLVSSNNVVYQYDVDNLTAGFLSDKITKGSSPLYNDFVSKFTNGGYFYAFHDDSLKYVNYSTITTAFLNNKASGSQFDLNAFTSSTSAMQNITPSAKVVTVSSGKIVYTNISTADYGYDLEVVSIE